MGLRKALAAYVTSRWEDEIPGLGITTKALIQAERSKEEYLRRVVKEDSWAGETELVLLCRVTGCRLRIFRSVGSEWHEYTQYGEEGRVCRLLYANEHYNLLIPKEAWQIEREQIEQELQHRLSMKWKGAHQRDRRRKHIDNEQRLSEAIRAEQRKCIRSGLRSQDPDEEDVELLLSISRTELPEEQCRALARALSCKTPWGILRVSQTATERGCVAAYRSLPILLHPDKCTHPRAAEAFKKLGDAHAWVEDREAWEAQRLQEWKSQMLTNQYAVWLSGSGPLKLHMAEEQLERGKHQVDEGLWRLFLEEERDWRVILGEDQEVRPTNITPRQSTRRKTQTAWYQSEEVSRRENEARGRRSRESNKGGS
jgi:hypothetical protein